MKVSNKHIPFYNFFLKLKTEAGIELDINQYKIFIDCFLNETGKGNGRNQREYILNLCKSLWMPNKACELQFEKLFDSNFNTYKELFISVKKKEPIHDSDRELIEKIRQRNSDEKQDKPIEDSLKEKKKAKEGNKKTSTENTGGVVEEFAREPIDEIFWNVDSGEDGKSNLKPSKVNATSENKFVFSDNHWPLRERQLIQIWRNIGSKRNFEKQNSPKIDIKKTIDKAAKDGFFTHLKFKQNIDYNQQQFIFLIDSGRTMNAFIDYAKLILTSFQSSLKPKHLTLFYFDGIINKNLFWNEGCTNALPLHQFFERLEKDSIVFIISDANAARNYRPSDIPESAFDFLQALQSNAQNTLWLNPVPKNRWYKGYANYFRLLIKMVEVSGNGVNEIKETIKHY